MANDRLYIQCKTCNKCKLLWKYYPFGGYLDGGYFWPGAEELAGFMERHLRNCHPVARHDIPGIPTLEGDPGFRLGCESDPAFDELGLEAWDDE